MLSAQSQAEFVLTKFLLSREAALPVRDLPALLAIDVFRFRTDDARWFPIVAAMVRISWLSTLQCGLMLTMAIATNPRLMRRATARFFRRKDMHP